MVKIKESIIVRIYGGLGNQFFQYAMGRALSLRSGRPLFLDVSWFWYVRFTRHAVRNFSLDHFPLDGISGYLKPSNPIAWYFFFLSKVSLFCGWVGKILWTKFYMEKQPHIVDQELLSYKKPIYIDGYWQSYKYFDDCADVIRGELGRVGAVSDATKSILQKIQESEAICVHIRRGDFVKLGWQINDYDYYVKGVEIARQGLDNPICFVFSDDPEWVRKNLKLNIPMQVVDVNGPEEAHQDMWLMMACRRFVIANSTFSWWGAWLSNRSDKIVVMPKDFSTTEDFSPKEWIRI